MGVGDFDLRKYLGGIILCFCPPPKIPLFSLSIPIFFTKNYLIWGILAIKIRTDYTKQQFGSHFIFLILLRNA